MTRPRSERSSANWTNCVRGDLYRLRTPRDAVGHEQRGERFAVVVQSDLLRVFSTVLIAPTSTSAREADFAQTELLQNRVHIHRLPRFVSTSK
jgi:mRNA interferase MazF